MVALVCLCLRKAFSRGLGRGLVAPDLGFIERCTGLGFVARQGGGPRRVRLFGRPNLRGRLATALLDFGGAALDTLQCSCQFGGDFGQFGRVERDGLGQSSPGCCQVGVPNMGFKSDLRLRELPIDERSPRGVAVHHCSPGQLQPFGKCTRAVFCGQRVAALLKVR